MWHRLGFMDNENRVMTRVGELVYFPYRAHFCFIHIFTQGVDIGLVYIWLTANAEGLKFVGF